MKSNCCQAEMTTSYGEEGTNCFICSKCKQPCDIYQERWKQLFDETRLMKEGGSFIECSDYEGICKDMYEFIEIAIKQEKIKMLEEFKKRIRRPYPKARDQQELDQHIERENDMYALIEEIKSDYNT